MIYLLVFLFILLYLYATEKFYSNVFYKQFIIWLPAYFVFIALPSMQYNVGTDYSVYFDYFFNNGHILHLRRGEILYYYLVEAGIYLNDPQVQFILVSLIQGFLFFYLLFLLKRKGYKAWLIFLIYFLVTGIYHNQMNGLRQYVCVYIIPILAIHIYEKKYLKSAIFSLISSLIHVSSVIPTILILFFSKINIVNKRVLFLIFVVSFFVYAINYSKYIFYVLEYFDMRYLNYADTKYSEGKSFLTLATKFYYLPILILFWFYYLKGSSDKGLGDKDRLFSFFILVFSSTHFMFLQAMEFDLLIRIWAYFNIFIVFPIYFVLIRLNRLSFLLVCIYLLLFYFSKVVLFPAAEYEYSIYRGWF